MTKSNSKKRATQKVFSGAALFSLALGASISALPVTVPHAYAVENIDYTNPDSLSGVSGTWYLPKDTGAVGTTTPRLEAAASEAYVKNNEVTVPAGYIADPVDGRETFGIVLLDELNDTNADYNERNGVNYYVTSSVDRNIGPGTIFVNLVDKNTNNIVRSFKLNEGDANVPLGLTDALSPQLGDSFFTLNYDVTYAADGSVAGREFRVKSAAGSDENHITIILNKANPSGEGAASNAPVVQVLTPATQTASYKVVGTHELLARYTQTGGYTGDLYAIAGPVTFDKYELVESPTLSADAKILVTDYALGVTADTIQSNTRRTRTVVEPDGSIIVRVYYLNPESPNLATLYGKDTANGGNALSDATNAEDWVLMYESQPIAPDSWNSVASDPIVHSWTIDGTEYSYRAVVTNYDDLSATGLLSTTAGLVSDPTYARVANDQRPAKALGIDDFRVGGFNWSLRNGNVKNEQHVTYWYAPKGDINVYYVDENGNEIQAKSDLTIGDKTDYYDTDTAYDTTTVKPEFITAADGKVYQYVAVDTNGLRPVTEGKEGKDEHGRSYALATSETGTVQQNTVQELTYVYKEVKSSVTVNYVDTDGNVLKDSVVDTTDASVGSDYDTNDNKPTEITVDGVKYVLVPSKTTAQVGTNDPVKSDGTGTVAQDPTQVTYVYQKVGSWVPQIPGVPVGEEPKIEYPFDPDNPDQPITPTPDNVIPYVPGYTPVDPNNNEPLVPVDPNDESKGYIPPTTTTPGNDTFIPYVEKDRGSVVVNFIDTKGNIIQAPVTDENSVYVDTPYDTTDQKKDTITVTNPDGSETEYRLVRTDGNETGKVVEGVTSVTYVYEKVEYGTVVVNYVDTNGNVIKDKVEDTARTETGAAYDTTDNKPAEITTEDGSRYVLVPSKTEGNETGTVVAGETAVTYVYQKVASWIPQLPDGSTPEIPYPFDPANPDQPVTPTPDTVIPYVPGYTPEDPNTGEPLKPVDPEDPSKGYIPPTTTTPGVDTLIPYVKNDPKDPTPVDPTNPADPGIPNQPITPADPTDPAQPSDPANPGNGGNTGGNTGGSTGGNTGGSTGTSTGSTKSTPAPKANSGSLANTGAEVGALAGAGALLLGLGAVLTRRGRRKKDSE